MLGVSTVLELCVGPSLRDLEAAYAAHDIIVTGNDIDAQWQRYYPRGRWIIGDAFGVDWSGFDAVVFAPPLSRGCTGARADSLSVAQVQPAYSDFLRRLQTVPRVPVAVLVLPGRAMATRRDRAETFALLAQCGPQAAVIPLRDARARVTKYHDVYLSTPSGS